MRLAVNLVIFSALGLTLAASVPTSAADVSDEKLLLGFEESEFEKLSKVIKLTKKEGKTKDGKSFVAWDTPGGFQPLGQWPMFKGNASQGDYAMGIAPMVYPDYLHYPPP